FFFFSSRRRHTRSKRDWSSDVCSSDLRETIQVAHPMRVATADDVARKRRVHIPVGQHNVARPQQRQHLPLKPVRKIRRVHQRKRSEERRVGKEGRTRREADQIKKEKNE